ncbi:hypothetical protein [Belnapia mucosa]|nr:hypothetical protein [Belnapia mucosa]
MAEDKATDQPKQPAPKPDAEGKTPVDTGAQEAAAKERSKEGGYQ